MLFKVRNFIEKHLVLKENVKIIVAVSGGPDSVALLHILNRLEYDCIAAHCNFHLRMEESDRDEKFVRKFTHDLGIKLESIDFNTLEFARDRNISVEMAARELRYEWFQNLAIKYNANIIATGHHGDDNVETLLINLVRGTTMKGLTGIPPVNGNIIRPLLDCTRSEILNYLTENNLNYVLDSTNQENEFVRNKIRNTIIPALEEINPSVKQTLNKTIERFTDIRNFYEHSVNEIIQEVVQKTDSEIKIDIEKILKNISPGLILFEILNPLGFHSAVIEQIEKSLYNTSGKKFYSSSYRLIKDRKFLIITANNKKVNGIYSVSQNEDIISLPLVIKIDSIKTDEVVQLKTGKNIIFVDAGILKFPLTIRKWQEGDYFFPFGMNGKKKISDFFIDRKFSINEKENTWLLTSGNEVVWIIGQRADNRFKVNDKTQEIIRLEYLK